jgi:hypothetical protein
MTQYLKSRNYPTKLIEQSKLKADSIVSNTSNRNNNQKLIFVTRFNPRLPPIKPIIMKYMDILTQDPKTKFLEDFQITLAYRRPQSIKDQLVKSDLAGNSIKKASPGSYPCRRRKCLCCPYMLSTIKFSSHTTGQEFIIRGHYNCQSINVIYMIQCKRCGKQYIGQTGNTLNTRFTSHRHDIRHKLLKSVPLHYTSDCHTINDLSLCVIMGAGHDVMRRHALETSWIRRLSTIEPAGLNSIE